MNLFFLRLGSQYIGIESKLGEEIDLDLTFFAEKARFWTHESPAKGMRTFLRNKGYDIFISVGTVTFDSFGNQL